MDTQNKQYTTLLKALLPEELFDYFEIVKVLVNPKTIDVYLDELNTPPLAYKSEKLVSKGFYTTTTIQDFPIRERALYLHVRRRKWQINNTGQVISNKWDTTAEGTRYTKDFASFLKEILR